MLARSFSRTEATCYCSEAVASLKTGNICADPKGYFLFGLAESMTSTFLIDARYSKTSGAIDLKAQATFFFLSLYCPCVCNLMLRQARSCMAAIWAVRPGVLCFL